MSPICVRMYLKEQLDSIQHASSPPQTYRNKIIQTGKSLCGSVAQTHSNYTPRRVTSKSDQPAQTQMQLSFDYVQGWKFQEFLGFLFQHSWLNSKTWFKLLTHTCKCSTNETPKWILWVWRKFQIDKAFILTSVQSYSQGCLCRDSLESDPSARHTWWERGYGKRNLGKD